MKKCAYCGRDGPLTKEHIIPHFLCNDLGDDTEGFIEKSPNRLIKGQLVVKDVCEKCNNTVLSDLDEYGSQLYIKYFKKFAYKNEQISITIDYDLLSRWLLKISYNSARANNTDLSILNKLKDVILGTKEVPSSLKIFLHLVTPSTIVGENLSRPSFREENEIAFKLEGMRISQFRFPKMHVIDCVQRTIFINSFCFTLFIFPENTRRPEKRQIVKMFNKFDYGADLLSKNRKTYKLNAGKVHTMATYAPHLYINQDAYGEVSTPFNYFPNLSEMNSILSIVVPKEEVVSGNVDYLMRVLSSMLVGKSTLLKVKQSVDISFHGYDDDPREVWEIPEIAKYVTDVDKLFPYWFFVLHPEGHFIKVLPSCLCRIEERKLRRIVPEKEDFKIFVEYHIHAFNELCHRFAIDLEINKSISMDIFKTYNIC